MKKKIFVILYLFSIIIKSFSANNTEVKTLTLEEAVKCATENNISIKKQSIALDDVKNKKKFSWNSISPSANINGNYKEDLESESNSIGITGTVSIGLSTNLYTSIQGAKLNYENGLITYEQTCRQIERDVRKSFFNLLYEQENLNLKKQNLETSYSQYKNNQEKFKSGQISELDVMTSRVNYEQEKPSVEQAAIIFKNDIAAFKQILGIEQNIQLELNGSLDDILNIKNISFENLPKTNKPAPEVQSAEKQIEIAKNNLLSQRFSAYSPSITASYNYGKTKTKNINDDITTNSLSIGVSIPLDGYLPWSSSAVNITSQKNNLKSAELNLEDAQTSIAVKTESYLRKINQSISQIESLKANVDLAKETYQMTKTAYNYGKTDLLNLQNANDSVLSANVSLKNQAYTLISTILDLEYILGIQFGTLTNTL